MKALPASIRQALETILTYFRTRPIARVWLFGSAARGESEPGDIDLLLELEAALHKRVDLVSK